MRFKRVLVTGGAGYVGRHTCKRLAREDVEVVVYDNLSGGHRHNVKWGPLVVGDILDEARLSEAFEVHRPDAVIHFAALAYVGESVTSPQTYYRTNVTGTLILLDQMLRHSVGSVVFSSTCATYGIPTSLPITEACRQDPVNPYGASKLMVERILADYAAAYGLRFAALRYFNACGADRDGELTEEHDPETHLIPKCLQAAAGLTPAIEVFGDDYPTPDGTCIRDYIHVEDLAESHVAALAALGEGTPCLQLNLGTGRGHSILEIIDAIERVTGRHVPYTMSPRRPGDPPELVASIEGASEALAFTARHSDLDTIIRTAWRQYA